MAEGGVTIRQSARTLAEGLMAYDAGVAPYRVKLRPNRVLRLLRIMRSRGLLRDALRGGTNVVPFTARLLVINMIGLALVAAVWAEGLITRPFQADHSGICYLITALFFVGLIATARKDWQTVRWIGNTLVYLGMIGTVLGLIITVSDLTVDKVQSFDSFKAIVTAIYIGSGTALYTNLLACIGYLWLGTNAHLLARQEV
jgi:hypothetical protein